MFKSKASCIFFIVYFVLAAVSSVIIGIQSGNEFNPVLNFAEIAALGIPAAVLVYVRKICDEKLKLKSVLDGLIMFAIAMAAYICEDLKQVPWEVVKTISYPEALLISAGIGIVTCILAYMWYSHKAKTGSSV